MDVNWHLLTRDKRLTMLLVFGCYRAVHFKVTVLIERVQIGDHSFMAETVLILQRIVERVVELLLIDI